MLTLDELLHPITPDRFMADYQGRKPLYIPAETGASKAAILDWERFNGLLSQSTHWTAATMKLVRDGSPIPPEHYCASAMTRDGVVFRPVPARVAVLLSTGASLIADDIQFLTPEMTDLSIMLSRTFAASIGANAYCSFGGVQAFGTHYDLHDVFAIHVAGEKTWKLYQNRAPDPVDPPGDGEDPRPFYARTRGALMQEVRMRPGDVLYLPRGWYHEALADGPAEGDNAALHVSFSVAPLHGRIVFDLLEKAAMQDPAFRAYFPPADRNGGQDLQRQLADLGQRLATIAASPFFAEEVAMGQERLVPRAPTYGLPHRPALTLYRATGLMAPAVAGPATHAIGWALSQPQFALEDLCAQFDFVPETEVRAAVATLERAGALKRL